MKYVKEIERIKLTGDVRTADTDKDSLFGTVLASTQHGHKNSLLGPDDDLDEPARAAKRQRIERLAESHLQGQPLFILSVSLLGLFDPG